MDICCFQDWDSYYLIKSDLFSINKDFLYRDENILRCVYNVYSALQPWTTNTFWISCPPVVFFSKLVQIFKFGLGTINHIIRLEELRTNLSCKGLMDTSISLSSSVLISWIIIRLLRKRHQQDDRIPNSICILITKWFMWNNCHIFSFKCINIIT